MFLSGESDTRCAGLQRRQRQRQRQGHRQRQRQSARCNVISSSLLSSRVSLLSFPLSFPCFHPKHPFFPEATLERTSRLAIIFGVWGSYSSTIYACIYIITASTRCNDTIPPPQIQSLRMACMYVCMYASVHLCVYVCMYV